MQRVAGLVCSRVSSLAPGKNRDGNRAIRFFPKALRIHTISQIYRFSTDTIDLWISQTNIVCEIEENSAR